jgi:8-oxo-dGTP diphosphatase
VSEVTLYMIRHAHAGNKHRWSGPDEERPLSAKGAKQSEAIAEQFADAGVKRIISSPAQRCRQTVQPLAGKLGLAIESDDALAEGTPTPSTLELVLHLAGEDVDAALCSHGDVIPALLQALEADGVSGDGNTSSAKAGVFVLDTDGGRITHAVYVPPPDVRGAKR